MTESLLWTDHVSQLKSFGQIKRLEDLIEKGVPDCVYCLRWLDERPRAGWIELKKLKMMKTGMVKLPHFTVDQARFLERWGRAGMGAYLLAQVARSFYLFDHNAAAEVQRGVTAERFKSLATVRGTGTFPVRDVLRELTRWPN